MEDRAGCGARWPVRSWRGEDGLVRNLGKGGGWGVRGDEKEGITVFLE